MTDLRKAAEMALEAMDDVTFGRVSKFPDARKALRQALAQPEQDHIRDATKKVEPAAWLIQYKTRHDIVWGAAPGLRSNDQILGMEPLYTAPPKREWVGLTDEELRQAYCEVSGKEWCLGGMGNAHTFYEAIEAKLKEKNS